MAPAGQAEDRQARDVAQLAEVDDRRPEAFRLARLQQAVDRRSVTDPRTAVATVGQRRRSAAVSPATTAVQRKKRFDNAEGAKAYVKENPPDRKKDTTAAKYFNRLKAQLGKAADKEDLGWLEPVATAAWGGTSAVERKALTATQWQHIWRGDLGAKGHPTGFHWKGKAGDAIAEGDGAVTATSGDFYHEGVNLKASKVEDGTVKKANVKRYDKPDGSTFFPDDWSEQDVKDAIELRNSSDQITTPADAAGQQLVKSGETIYPSIK